MADSKLDVIPTPVTPSVLGERAFFSGPESVRPNKILGQRRTALETSCPRYVSVFDFQPDSNATCTQ